MIIDLHATVYLILSMKYVYEYLCEKNTDREY